MLGVYIFVGVCILGIIIFTIWCVNLLLVPQIKLQKSGVGERTKFVIDTTDKGYDYYEKLISDWLKYNKFPSYNKKKNGRVLKYYIKGLILRFGFNHYREGQNMIIEAWLSVFGQENPLSVKSYSHNEGTVDLATGLAGEGFKAKEGTSIAVNQQGKDEYLVFLSSLINIPEIIENTNNVTLKDNFDLSKISNQETEKKENHKLIFIILAISFALTAIIYLLGLEWH